MNPIIASKMDTIKSIFQSSREKAANAASIGDLVQQLDTTEKDYLPVAYEGAAMELALRDFANGETIDGWKAFLASSKKYACQIYIGMGWAVGQEKRTPLTFLDELNKNMQFRIWDGCGYFDGIFRQRQTIKGQNRLEYIEPKDFQAYDEGLGRSIWYICKGDETKVPEMINAFAAERRSDLWRGVGIACSFVGGFEKEALEALLTSAGEHRIQLGIGAAMVAKSRIEADCFTNDIDRINSICNGLTAEEAMKITVKNKTVPNFSFSNFILEMEKDLIK